MREVVRAKNHSRSRSLGRIALPWMHHFLIHGPGDVAEIPLAELPLSDELSGVVLDCYALDEDGHRLYDSAFLSRSKGVAKSEFAGFMGIFDAMGPSRFAGWAKGGEVYEWLGFRHVYGPGEPMGKPIRYPFWRIMATEEGQAGEIFDVVFLNLREGPLRDAFPQADDVGLTRVFLPDGGEIRPCTASGATKDGGKETHGSFDETHLYTKPELRRMYDTVRRNLRKRKEAEPWSFETSTMYEVGRDSSAERSHALAKAMKAKPEQAHRFFFDHRQAPDDVDLTDDNAVVAALREAYGDATYMDFGGLLSHFRDPRNEIEDSIRYYFNQANASKQKAFSLMRWRELAKPDYHVQQGALITIGFDGSRSQDWTAAIATEVATGFQWPLGIWARPDGVEEWTVDEDYVDAVIDEAFRSYDVWRMYADPPWWETALARWAGRYGEQRVVAWYTNRLRQMAYCLRGYIGAINEGDLTHDGDQRFEAAIGNAVKQMLNIYDDEGKPLFVITKERQASPLKIDPAVAGALSYKARLDAVASGKLEPEPEASVFFLRR